MNRYFSMDHVIPLKQQVGHHFYLELIQNVCTYTWGFCSRVFDDVNICKQSAFADSVEVTSQSSGTNFFINM